MTCMYESHSQHLIGCVTNSSSVETVLMESASLPECLWARQRGQDVGLRAPEEEASAHSLLYQHPQPEKTDGPASSYSPVR